MAWRDRLRDGRLIVEDGSKGSVREGNDGLSDVRGGCGRRWFASSWLINRCAGGGGDWEDGGGNGTSDDQKSFERYASVSGVCLISEYRCLVYETASIHKTASQYNLLRPAVTLCISAVISSAVSYGAEASNFRVRQAVADHTWVRRSAALPQVLSNVVHRNFFGGKTATAPKQQSTLSVRKGTEAKSASKDAGSSKPIAQDEKEDDAVVKQDDDEDVKPTLTAIEANGRLLPQNDRKRGSPIKEESDEDSDDGPPIKKQRTQIQPATTPSGSLSVTQTKPAAAKHEDTDCKSGSIAMVKTEGSPAAVIGEEGETEDELSEHDQEDSEEEEEKPEVVAKKREKVQSTLTGKTSNPYPDWKAGDPVPYAALCTTFSKIEMTSKRLEISAHCSLFLRQVLRLTPNDLLPTILLMVNKLAADYSGVELGIGESLIMKAIGETTGRTLAVIKAVQNEIGDLGLVAVKSRSNQPTMFKPKPLTVRGVHDGLLAIATIEGQGTQGRKIAGIKKLLSAADSQSTGKGGKAVDITKDKGGRAKQNSS
ncbi:hypothetical protein MRB53_040387 [Persea americana]|nr:hypothetical protein MRB53_040387 [Persea americana]